MSVRATPEKAKVIAKHRLHATDSGSCEVQVATITQRIVHLTKHFQSHVKDHGSRQGLLKLVSQRRKLLEYLKTQDAKRYASLIESLDIRK